MRQRRRSNGLPAYAPLLTVGAARENQAKADRKDPLGYSSDASFSELLCIVVARQVQGTARRA